MSADLNDSSWGFEHQVASEQEERVSSKASHTGGHDVTMQIVGGQESCTAPSSRFVSDGAPQLTKQSYSDGWWTVSTPEPIYSWPHADGLVWRAASFSSSSSPSASRQEAGTPSPRERTRCECRITVATILHTLARTRADLGMSSYFVFALAASSGRASSSP